MFYLTTYSTHFIFTVIWYRTYAIDPHRQQERKPAFAIIWDTFLDLGKVRSDCLTCTFRERCSARLSRAQVPAVPLSGTRKEKGEGVREDRLHWRVQGSTSSPTGIGSRRRVV